VARYAKEHKQATRHRIIETAGHRFKQDGIDGSGIATLMADAGLTNGAFYAHFESKNELITHTIIEEMRAQHARLTALAPGRKSLQDFVRDYLSPEHRDAPAAGCPSAALLDEIGRCDEATRQAYTQGAIAITEAIATHLSPKDPAAARTKALGLYTLLVGTLQLSRAVSDQALSAEVLEQGVRNTSVLIG